jgi:hypothetical protein
MKDGDWKNLFGPIDATASLTPSAAGSAAPPGPTPEVAPGVFDMAASFASSIARFAAGGFRTVQADILEQRLAVCRGCEQHHKGNCHLCGCFVEAKARLPHEVCPAGKWLAEER